MVISYIIDHHAKRWPLMRHGLIGKRSFESSSSDQIEQLGLWWRNWWKQFQRRLSVRFGTACSMHHDGKDSPNDNQYASTSMLQILVMLVERRVRALFENVVFKNAVFPLNGIQAKFQFRSAKESRHRPIYRFTPFDGRFSAWINANQTCESYGVNHTVWLPSRTTILQTNSCKLYSVKRPCKATKLMKGKLKTFARLTDRKDFQRRPAWNFRNLLKLFVRKVRGPLRLAG